MPPTLRLTVITTLLKSPHAHHTTCLHCLPVGAPANFLRFLHQRSYNPQQICGRRTEDFFFPEKVGHETNLIRNQPHSHTFCCHHSNSLLFVPQGRSRSMSQENVAHQMVTITPSLYSSFPLSLSLLCFLGVGGVCADHPEGE
jgi:hypothetical protein